MFSQNCKIVKDGNGYIIRVGGHDLDRLFERHKGNVHVEITKPVSEGTDEQNRAFHALIQAYYLTGMHSAPDGSTLEDFKIHIKWLYGPRWTKEIKGEKFVILKSWGDYNKTERCDMIDAVINEIHQAGAYAESEKIREIIAGMEYNADMKRR